MINFKGNEVKLSSELIYKLSFNSSEGNYSIACSERFDLNSSVVKVCSELSQRLF